MGKHYIAITVLGIVVVIVISFGFLLSGSPFSQRLISLDQIRINDFNTMRYRIEDYYRSNNNLPSSLIDVSAIPRKEDPETNTEYIYQKVSATEYNFCTNFSTDSQEIRKLKQSPASSYSYNTYNQETDHKKGFDCIKYEIPKYLQNDYNQLNKTYPTLKVSPTLPYNKNRSIITH